MFPYTEHPEIFNQILLLPDKSYEAAMACLEDFVSNYNLAEIRQILWDMVENCLTSGESNYSEPGARADLLLQFRHLQELVESAFVMVDHWNLQKL